MTGRMKVGGNSHFKVLKSCVQSTQLLFGHFRKVLKPNVPEMKNLSDHGTFAKVHSKKKGKKKLFLRKKNLKVPNIF